jgi:hypothetical protein
MMLSLVGICLATTAVVGLGVVIMEVEKLLIEAYRAGE